MVSNLIIGTIRGYNYDALAPFVETLARSGYDGELLLFHDVVSQETLHQLARFPRTTLIPRKYAGNGPENPNGRLWPFARHAMMLPLPARARAGYVRSFLNIATVRFLWARDYLHENAERYDNVLLTDVRDVIFQRNPFDGSRPKPISAFLEAPKMRFGSDPSCNDAWIVSGYGQSALAELNGKRISCCGTVLGSIKGMLRYLSAFELELPRLKSVKWGADTCIHNRLIYGALAEDVEICENFVGGIATLANVPDEDLSFDSKGYLVAPNGQPVPVIHQYRPEVYNRTAAALGLQ